MLVADETEADADEEAEEEALFEDVAEDDLDALALIEAVEVGERVGLTDLVAGREAVPLAVRLPEADAE